MRILPAFRGTMIHGCWVLYFGYSSDHPLCHAHLLRELQGVSENSGHRWSETLRALLIKMNTAVDAAKQSIAALLPGIRAAFGERHHTILEAGRKATETTGVPEDQGEARQKEAVQGEESPGRLSQISSRNLGIPEGFHHTLHQ